MPAGTSNLTRPDFDHALWHRASFSSSTGSDGHRVMTAMSIYKSEWKLAELKLDAERIRRISNPYPVDSVEHLRWQQGYCYRSMVNDG